MKLLGIQPKRSLGQNFLISDHVVHRIIDKAEPKKFHKTFEIGPGLGALTDLLLEKSKQVELIELDKNFSQFWREQGATVSECDALKYAWDGINWELGDYLLVSNLPYQISSRLVVELSLLEKSFSRMVLMFQKEVAQRITASAGNSEYGLLSVVVQCFWKTQHVVEAGTIDFLPKPNVASRVVLFENKGVFPAYVDRKEFLNFLKMCFTNRRKMLLPKLVSFKSKAELAQLFKELQLEESIRAEKLNPQQFIELYLSLKKEY